MDESAQAKVMEMEYEKEHGHCGFGLAHELAISCVLAIVLMAFCFLTLSLIRASWDTRPGG